MDSRIRLLSNNITKCLDALRSDKTRPIIQGEFPVDNAVIRVLPEGCVPVNAKFYGRCCPWFATACFETIDAGRTRRFFLKYAVGQHGEAQLEGEYYSMSTLYQKLPQAIPQPFGYGTLDIKCLQASFYLSEFIEFDERASLDPDLVGKTIALLHKANFRPDMDRFGADIPTWDGVFEQTVEWQPSWAKCFGKMLKHHFDCDRLTNGPWDEFSDYMCRTQEIVIPRLLGPLEGNGNRITPCFIHGDLWEGNFGIEKESGRLFIFDANGYFAHHEMELGMWRVEHHEMNNPKYRDEYLKNMGASTPASQFDDRNRLYSVKYSLAFSFHHPGNSARHKAFEDLRYLVEKYYK